MMDTNAYLPQRQESLIETRSYVKRVVVFAPHSDDAELGLGGYLARLKKQGGHCVEVYVLAAGSRSSTKDNQQVSQDTRFLEGRAAADLIGFDVLQFLEVAPDGALNTATRSEIVREIERVLNEGPNPYEIFIPLPSYHPDHVVVYEACISALRARNGANIGQRVLAYEYPGNAWGPAAPPSARSYMQLDQDDFDTKLRALGCHRSQWVSSGAAPLIGLNAVVALGSLRGSEIGVPYAEMFHVIREIRC